MTSGATLKIYPPLSLQGLQKGNAARLLMRIGLSCGLFVVALGLSSERVAWRDLAGIGTANLAACLILSAAMILLLAWRWRYVVTAGGTAGTAPSLAAFAGFSWAGLAVNQILPSVVGGDALRATLLARSGVRAVDAASSVFVDRIYGFAGLAVLGLAGAPLLRPFMSGQAALWSALAAGALLAVGLWIGTAKHWPERLRSLSATLVSGLSLRSAAILVPAAIGGHLMNMAIFFIVAHSLGADLPVLPTMAVLSAVLLVSALPVSIAGWGLREVALVQAFSGSVPQHDKIILSSVAYGLLLLLTQATGFLMILWGRRT